MPNELARNAKRNCALHLDLQRLQTARLIGQETYVHLFPVEVGQRADACLAADLSLGHVVIALLQNERFLRVRKLRCVLRSLPLPAERITRGKLQDSRSSYRGSEQPSEICKSPYLTVLSVAWRSGYPLTSRALAGRRDGIFLSLKLTLGGIRRAFRISISMERRLIATFG